MHILMTLLYICKYMYVCVCVCVYTNTHKYTHICMRAYICMYVCGVCVCILIKIHI
jgi:hypothetical protein